MPQDFRYRRLGYVALNVSDVERSGDFYRDFVGLTPAGQALNGEHLFRCSERHHDVVLHQSDAVGLRRVGWEMESAKDVASIRTHLQSLDIEPHPVAAAECDALGISRRVPDHRTEYRRDVRVLSFVAQSRIRVRSKRCQNCPPRTPRIVREGSQGDREVLSGTAELPRVRSDRRHGDVHALLSESAASLVRARQRRREPAEPRQLHGHRHGRHRPRDVSHEEERRCRSCSVRAGIRRRSRYSCTSSIPTDSRSNTASAWRSFPS